MRLLRGRFILLEMDVTFLLWGKSLETVGALLIAYVAVRAAFLELLVGRHLRFGNASSDDIESFRKKLSDVLEHRRHLFTVYEATIVGVGTVLVFLGCLLYLIGIFHE
jgi:hypothetical protein